MISFFLNTMRNLRKQKGYVILNILGLAVGLASFLFITLYVLNELSYDRFHKKYKNIYRVKVAGRMSGSVLDQAITAPPMANALVRDYPEIITAARITGMGDKLIGLGDTRFNEDGVLFADSTFFDVFDFKMLRGDPKTALVRPRSMVLTKEYAVKYFGGADPIGQKISFEADSVLYTVTGVVEDVPGNSHIKFDILGSMSSHPGRANNPRWLNHNFYTYILVREGTEKDVLQEKIQEMVIKYIGPQLQEFIGTSLDDFKNAGNDFRFVLEPLKDIHLKGASEYNLEPMGSPATVYVFAAIALMILVIAIINYVNLATARSANRAKEVGVRKVSGATKKGLIVQFLGESLLVVTVAALIALILVYTLTPFFNNLVGHDLTINVLNNFNGIIAFIGLCVVVGIAAGSYPAFVLASYNPSEVLKGSLTKGSMSVKLRGLLVIIQFTISIVIIIGSIVVYNQLNFITKKDLGFIKENLLIIRRPDAFHKQMKPFRDRLLHIPGIEKVGFSRAVPGGSFNNNVFYNDDDPEKNTYRINQTQVSFDFPQALGVEITDGRFFSKDYGADSLAVLINEAAVRLLGLKDPVGKYILQPAGQKQFTRLQIIGIMKDFNIESLHKPITPVCFTVLREGGGDQFATVRLNGAATESTIRSIEEVWQEFTKRQPFQYDFFTGIWNKLYESEMKTGKVFLIFSVLAILIACLGLIGLVSYLTTKRTREIGIRKSFGASNLVVIRLLSGEVIYLIIIASVFAYPLAYFGSEYWLEGFADKASVSPLIYIYATIIGFITGWLSISYQTFKAANYNPAQALRLD